MRDLDDQTLETLIRNFSDNGDLSPAFAAQGTSHASQPKTPSLLQVDGVLGDLVKCRNGLSVGLDFSYGYDGFWQDEICSAKL